MPQWLIQVNLGAIAAVAIDRVRFWEFCGFWRVVSMILGDIRRHGELRPQGGERLGRSFAASRQVSLGAEKSGVIIARERDSLSQ